MAYYSGTPPTEVDGKWCTIGVGDLIPVVGPADSLIGWVAPVAIRDGNLTGGWSPRTFS